MTFLPVVERELRTAARRKFTYRGRVLAALLALCIFGMMLLVQSGAGMPAMFGQLLFRILAWLAFSFAVVAGIFFTSDSLSEEKREGTLGLLFLTDLRGHDVVLGKLISSSVQAFYGLLAAIPIIGMTLLLGGVLGGTFFQTMLAVTNTLFLSLACGLFVSSISRSAIKTMNGTLLLLLILLLGLPGLDEVIAYYQGSPSRHLLRLASPGSLFAEAMSGYSGNYWTSLGLQHLLGWTFLGLSAFWTPRAWQEKTRTNKAPRAGLAHSLRFGGATSRLRWRRKMLDRNPLLWLAVRDRQTQRIVWSITILLTLLWGLVTWSVGVHVSVAPARVIFLWNLGGWMHLILYFWVAAQAGRFFIDATRNGMMELVLATPVSPGQIIRSQWGSLWRIFVLPVVVLALMEALPNLAYPNFRTGIIISGRDSSSDFLGLILFVLGILSFPATCAAVAWFGMWRGLGAGKITTTALASIFYVVILPTIALYATQVFLVMILVRPAMMSLGFNWSFYLVQILFLLLVFAKNAAFIVWSRNRMLTRLREVVARGGIPEFLRIAKFRTP